MWNSPMKNIFTSKQKKQRITLKSSWLETPLGFMVAVTDEKALYFLEFVERQRLEEKIEKFCAKANANIVPEMTPIIESVESELKTYFEGKLKTFKIPLILVGSPFQENAWRELMHTPYGQTRSYTDQAIALERPLAFRAVANANGANNIAIIVPCHRIINNNGALGGYGGGISRKKWLLNHEQQMA